MKDLQEIINEMNELTNDVKRGMTLNELKADMLVERIVPMLVTELNSEQEMIDNYVNETKELLIEGGMPAENIDEGFLGKLIGGAAGFLIGPKIGRVIAKALGIEKGVMYDMLTSKLVSTALGVSISKSFSKK